MANKQQKLQKTTPKGINPKTGKPYEPIERKTWDRLVQRVAKPRQGKT